MGAPPSPRQRVTLSFLLDEHYPGWLADALAAGGIDAVALVRDRPELRGADDQAVLEHAAGERRVVVTEEVTTFRFTIASVPAHVGVVFCHSSRFPRTRVGMNLLRVALVELTRTPPAGLGEHSIEWWLAAPT